MHKDVWAETVERIILSTAVGGLTAADIVAGVGQEKLLGYPVKLVEVMPKVEANSQVCVLFGDLSLGSMLGRRSQIVMTRDTSKGFDTDTVYMKTTQRVDVVVHDVGNASGTAALRVPGPIVGLITAAS